MRQFTRQKPWAKPAALVFWLLVWQGAALLVNVPVMLPTPRAVASAWAELAATKAFYLSTLYSLARVMAGFALGVLLGLLSAGLISASRIADTLLSPLLVCIKSTPIASFIMLSWVFVGSANLPTLVAALMVLPVVSANMVEGVRKIDRRLVEVTQVFGFSRRKRLRHLYLPSLLPYVRSALLTSLGFAWKSGIAAEVLAQTKQSIGREIFFSKAYLLTPELFAWTITVIALSMALEGGAKLLFAPRRRKKSEGEKDERHAETTDQKL